jgi:hypothetical protein
MIPSTISLNAGPGHAPVEANTEGRVKKMASRGGAERSTSLLSQLHRTILIASTQMQACQIAAARTPQKIQQDLRER